ncbi:hypothetical protein [Natronolimnohabitans innermongolicus]|uniref:DUF8151 domain-containing protein n=1 Tax=Natronolimnohabitans innermongolicus JCM 12255 TaxID=1227499 RepID=L9X2S6_9EURY|nr:hypothetical protein [Natronolimnohabitans innermongolicus]ELY54903.1 hypothetical protein C493_12027 [Natronolimnohabitans innermongolicus JCM 12255]
MGSGTPELLVELLPLLLYTIAAAVLTAAGLMAEYTSLQYLGSGDVVVALWLAVLGGVMLYAGVYGLGYKKVAVRALDIAHR